MEDLRLYSFLWNHFLLTLDFRSVLNALSITFYSLLLILLQFLNFLYVSLLAISLTLKIAFCKLYPVQLTVNTLTAFLCCVIYALGQVFWRDFFYFIFPLFSSQACTSIVAFFTKGSGVYRARADYENTSTIRSVYIFADEIRLTRARGAANNRGKRILQLAEQLKPKSRRADNRFGVWGPVGSGGQNLLELNSNLFLFFYLGFFLRWRLPSLTWVFVWWFPDNILQNSFYKLLKVVEGVLHFRAMTVNDGSKCREIKKNHYM